MMSNSPKVEFKPKKSVALSGIVAENSPFKLKNWIKSFNSKQRVSLGHKGIVSQENMG